MMIDYICRECEVRAVTSRENEQPSRVIVPHMPWCRVGARVRQLRETVITGKNQEKTDSDNG